MGSLAFDRRSAEGALGEALLFVSHPATLSALDQRRLGLRHARALMDVLETLPPELADQVEERVLAALSARPGRAPARVRELARREALRLDPDAAVQRRTVAARKRQLHLRDAGDGMVELVLLMRAEHGLAVLHRAEATTRHDDGSGRTRDQRRLDWAVDQLLRDDGTAADQQPGSPSAGSQPEPPLPGAALVPDGRRRRPVQVLVHIPVTTALGLDDEPCDLEEVGPIDADHGRLLLTVAELRKVCVDATTGQVLHVDDAVVRPVPDPQRMRDLGGTARAQAQAAAEAVRQALLDMLTSPSVMPVDPEPQYRPSAALSRTVRARHPRCDFLTCSCPSRSADLEHDRPHHKGGETSAGNISPRSRWCHGAKQRGWSAALLPDGTTVWHSPSGRVYPAQPQHEPPPRLAPDAALRPPERPPPRDDNGPPYGIPDVTDEAPITVAPARRRPGVPPSPGSSTPAQSRAETHGWSDEAPF